MFWLWLCTLFPETQPELDQNYNEYYYIFHGHKIKFSPFILNWKTKNSNLKTTWTQKNCQTKTISNFFLSDTSVIWRLIQNYKKPYTDPLLFNIEGIFFRPSWTVHLIYVKHILIYFFSFRAKLVIRQGEFKWVLGTTNLNQVEMVFRKGK